MSYQLVCDNCGTNVPFDKDKYYTLLPNNWESVYGTKPLQHLYAECVMVKSQAKWDIQGKIRKAEEEALAARRVKA